MTAWTGIEEAGSALDAVMPARWQYGGVERIPGSDRWRAWALGERGARIVTEGRPTQREAILELRTRIAREFHSADQQMPASWEADR